MRRANYIGADKYFHARGNYDAARRGTGGRHAAAVIRYVLPSNFQLTELSQTCEERPTAEKKCGQKSISFVDSETWSLLKGNLYLELIFQAG